MIEDVLDDRWIQLLIDDAGHHDRQIARNEAIARRDEVSSPLTIARSSTRRRGETRRVRIRVSGELDAASSPQLHRAVCEALDDAEQVQLDLGRLEFCDSHGVRTITSLLAEAARTRVPMAIVDVHPFVQRVFDLAGLGDVVASAQAGDDHEPRSNGSASRQR